MSGVEARTLAELHVFLDTALPDFIAEYGNRTDFPACRAWHRIMADGNWVGLDWPVEFGGLDLDLATQVACENALSAAGAPQIAGFIGVNTIAPVIMHWGTSEQRAVLPSIRTGDALYCQGFSEPGAGSDLASLRTRAEPTAGGFVLNGQKIWTSHGAEADTCLVLARTEPIEKETRTHRGLSLLLVQLNIPGVTVVPIRQLNGNSEFAEIFFDDVALPPTALLGPMGEGWRVAMSALAHERAAALVLATRTRAAVRSALTRNPVVDRCRRDEALQLFVDAEVLGLLAERCIAEIGAGSPGPAQSVVKLAWSSVDQRHADLAFDLAGASAAAGGAPTAAEGLLFSRSSTIAAGTTEVMRNILAEQVLSLPR